MLAVFDTHDEFEDVDSAIFVGGGGPDSLPSPSLPLSLSSSLSSSLSLSSDLDGGDDNNDNKDDNEDDDDDDDDTDHGTVSVSLKQQQQQQKRRRRRRQSRDTWFQMDNRSHDKEEGKKEKLSFIHRIAETNAAATSSTLTLIRRGIQTKGGASNVSLHEGTTGEDVNVSANASASANANAKGEIERHAMKESSSDPTSGSNGREEEEKEKDDNELLPSGKNENESKKRQTSKMRDEAQDHNNHNHNYNREQGIKTTMKAKHVGDVVGTRNESIDELLFDDENDSDDEEYYDHDDEIDEWEDSFSLVEEKNEEKEKDVMQESTLDHDVEWHTSSFDNDANEGDVYGDVDKDRNVIEQTTTDRNERGGKNQHAETTKAVEDNLRHHPPPATYDIGTGNENGADHSFSPSSLWLSSSSTKTSLSSSSSSSSPPHLRADLARSKMFGDDSPSCRFMAYAHKHPAVFVTSAAVVALVLCCYHRHRRGRIHFCFKQSHVQNRIRGEEGEGGGGGMYSQYYDRRERSRHSFWSRAATNFMATIRMFLPSISRDGRGEYVAVELLDGNFDDEYRDYGQDEDYQNQAHNHDHGKATKCSRDLTTWGIGNDRSLNDEDGIGEVDDGQIESVEMILGEWSNQTERGLIVASGVGDDLEDDTMAMTMTMTMATASETAVSERSGSGADDETIEVDGVGEGN